MKKMILATITILFPALALATTTSKDCYNQINFDETATLTMENQQLVSISTGNDDWSSGGPATPVTAVNSGVVPGRSNYEAKGVVFFEGGTRSVEDLQIVVENSVLAGGNGGLWINSLDYTCP